MALLATGKKMASEQRERLARPEGLPGLRRAVLKSADSKPPCVSDTAKTRKAQA